MALRVAAFLDAVVSGLTSPCLRCFRLAADKEDSAFDMFRSKTVTLYK